MRSLVYILLFLLAVIPTTFRVGAQTDTTKGFGVKNKTTSPAATGKTYALITGISQYQDFTTYQNLRYADADAREFYRYLVSKTGGKADPVNVDTLFNQQANFMEFWKKFNKIKESLQPNDIFYIYFSGHGDAYRADEAYLLAYDAPAGNDRNNYSTGVGLIDIHKLKVRIQEMTSRDIHVILITDACRTNELPGKDEGKSIAYQQIFERKAGEVQLISCASNQVSYEGYQWGGGRGLFSWHLINGLRGMADTDPEDGVVTLTELYDYVKKQVNRASFDPQTKGSRQTPQYCCNNYDALVMSTVDPEEKKRLEAELINGVTMSKPTAPLVAGKGISLGIAMKEAGYEDLYKEFIKALNEGKLIDSGGAYDILRRILDKKELSPKLASELKFELSSHLMTDVAKVINTYLHAGQNNNKYTYNYFITAARKLNIFQEIADTLYYNPLDVKVNQLFLEGHANWQSQKIPELMYCLAKVDSAVALKPQAAYLYNLKGLMHMSLRQYTEAEKALRTGIKLAPNWLYPHHNLGMMFTYVYKYDSALHYLDKALKLDSNYQTTFGGIAYMYTAKGENQTALTWVKKGLEKDPTDPYLWSQQGYLYYYMKEWDKALASFHQSIHFDSTFNYAYEGALRVHIFHNTNEDSAVYYTRRLIATDPTNPVVYQSLGSIFAETKLYDYAQEMFKHSLDLDSLNPYTWRAAADAYAGDQKDSIAIRYYWRSVGLDSANSDLYNQLCLSYYRLGMMREALSAVGNAIRLYSGNKVYFYNYGFISLEIADTLKAEEYFQRSIEVDPKYADGWYQLARVKAMLGKKTEAIKSLDKATKNATYTRQTIVDDAVFEKLKNEKAFQDILKRLK